jgi:hypothetical protein
VLGPAGNVFIERCDYGLDCDFIGIWYRPPQEIAYKKVFVARSYGGEMVSKVDILLFAKVDGLWEGLVCTEAAAV